jgi:hypothetical protein
MGIAPHSLLTRADEVYRFFYRFYGEALLNREGQRDQPKPRE